MYAAVEFWEKMNEDELPKVASSAAQGIGARRRGEERRAPASWVSAQGGPIGMQRAKIAPVPGVAFVAMVARLEAAYGIAHTHVRDETQAARTQITTHKSKYKCKWLCAPRAREMCSSRCGDR